MISSFWLLHFHQDPHIYSGYKASDVTMFGLCLLLLTFWMPNKVLPLVLLQYMGEQKSLYWRPRGGYKDGPRAVRVFYIVHFQQANLKPTY